MGFLPLSWNVVGIFYSPSQLGCLSLWWWLSETFVLASEVVELQVNYKECLLLLNTFGQSWLADLEKLPED